MSSADVSALFSAAHQDGTLSKGALAVLDAEDLGAVINQGLGITPDQVSATDIQLIIGNIDDSSSIASCGNEQPMRDGYNLVYDSLLGTKQKGGILMAANLFNRGLLHGFDTLENAVRLDARNYNPSGGTPLYDSTAVVLGLAAAKRQQFSDNGVPARAIVPIYTDGADVGSRMRASDIEIIVRDLLQTEQFIVIGVGIDDSTKDHQGNVIRKGTDFKAVFQSMGIQDRWILTPGNSPSEIRGAFAMVSQSVSLASQNAGSFSKGVKGGFSQGAMGGFGA